MKKYIVTCDKCGKEHKSNSVKVRWNTDTLGWDCVKCIEVCAVFTISEVRRMLENMENAGDTAIVYIGHVANGQWNKKRQLKQR